MFKFDFNLEDDDIDNEFTPSQSEPSTETLVNTEKTSSLKSFEELPLSSLLAQLPLDISYSPISIPLPNGEPIVLPRRDLFDARLQLIVQDATSKPNSQEGVVDAPDDLAFLEAPSDLVPGVYEGGLKTWECSLDLVICLHDLFRDDTKLLGKRIIELGCGTAVPTLYLIQRIFSAPLQAEKKTVIHLQDYNDLVFRLVTLPNIILAWYMSPASLSFRESYQPPPTDGAEEESLPPADASSPGELAFSSELIAAFEKSLTDYGIELRFFSGSWQTFNLQSTGGKYDILLTSETIYRTDSLPSLIDVMRSSCLGRPNEDKTQDETLANLSAEKLSISSEDSSYVCLVAAKLVYFGVGGGVAEFVRAVKKELGTVKYIWETSEGVKRCVMRVTW
ncbi:hypothetical protein QCA50_011782 [Cerrena zonata]|uniref:protein-histidine N-methyltransferase n=1 Tax=Cerrena zonata TaxID=2478898 RepID=A0AAW0G089_9APHY